MTVDTTRSYLDGGKYLSAFWPRRHRESDVWDDNRFLLSSYVRACRILGRLKKRWTCLDISTGPVLAPIMVLAPILDDVQLSDYCASSRRTFERVPVGYWRGYAREIIKLEQGRSPLGAVDGRLQRAALLARQRPLVGVDLFRTPLFEPDLDASEFDLFSMHFVADSITGSVRDYDAMIARVARLVRSGNALLMSSLIDGRRWMVGEASYPSPNLTLDHVQGLLMKHGLSLRCTKVQRRPAGGEVGHDGRFAVILAVRP
jgi:hypothetical protein